VERGIAREEESRKGEAEAPEPALCTLLPLEPEGAAEHGSGAEWTVAAAGSRQS